MLSAFVLLFDGFSNYCGEAFGKAFNGLQLQDYGKIERTFRKFDGRRNSYIIFILIGVLLRVPFYSLIAIAFWSFMSAAFYCLRTVQHLNMMDHKEHF